MGCDIHMHVEMKAPDGRWWHILEPYAPRNYVLFGHLAGVRYPADSPMEPQGFPKDADYRTIEAYTQRIVSEEEYDNQCECDYAEPVIGRETFEKHLEKGYVTTFDDERIVGQDWHTASHMDYWIFEMQLSRAEKEVSEIFVEYRALANYMNTFQSVGKETRIVFWFDN